MPIKKISVISRNPDTYIRETKDDIHRVQFNRDPLHHPFQEARGYKLALNAVKTERMLAKPFLDSLVHTETVCTMARHPNRLSCMFSGTVEGELYQWNLQARKKEWKVQAHDGHVYDISANPGGDFFYTVGRDQTIKQWKSDYTNSTEQEPLDSWLCDTPLEGISHNQGSSEFVTCGEKVYLWDLKSKAPKHSYAWYAGHEGFGKGVNCIKFNPIEKHIFAATDNENTLSLYDTRSKEIVNRITLKFRLNAIDWNPMEQFILAGASEDYSCYTFDIRNLGIDRRIAGIHRGHTMAVIDICFSPTGREFVSGSYDKSIRIFRTVDNESRDIYHTKRMFKVLSVLWSGDDKYVLSGSTDHNVRMWKARASEKMGLMTQREKLSLQYNNELKKKYAKFDQIKKIAKHRHLPNAIYHSKQELKAIKQSQLRKQRNRKLNSKPGSVVDKTNRESAMHSHQEDQIQLNELLQDHSDITVPVTRTIGKPTLSAVLDGTMAEGLKKKKMQQNKKKSSLQEKKKATADHAKRKGKPTTKKN